jgi:uncharacterized damage-inducible protein DinB
MRGSIRGLMEGRFRLAACLFAIAVSFSPALRAAGKPQASQSSGGQATVLGDLLKDWQTQKKTMMDIADAMPEDKFSYKTTPAQRTFGEQIMHVVQVNAGLLKSVGGKTAAPAMASAKSKAEILKALSDSYDYGTALLNEQTDATIVQTIQGPRFMGAATRARIFWFLLSHSSDIYGQMAVYLRLNGIVPPASRNSV